ncbi:Phosphate transport system permease protein PstA [Devosia equisanguinis]|uniref:Phosphate transport system permease protein PstA n=1 Tax=Devosia equisanguinis TaxID=2490941 RepID=A0A447IBK6_9HYPH|nr:phosphate ABC transporter permease PstA [Devosia equisanguinis]VDS04858.1 Phosphate transport system permease protein PstA [Devosia equisanguinis]
MTDTTLASAAERRKLVRDGLNRRHAGERLFRAFGIIAICLALGFVALLFTDVLRKGIPAFTQSNIHLEVSFDPELIKVEPAPVRVAGQSDADFRSARLAWERQVAMLNWNNVIEAALRKAAPADLEIDSRQLLTVVETDARHRVRQLFVENPDLLGKTAEVDLLASANADNWVKGNINRDLGDTQQQLPPAARSLIDTFEANGIITQGFAWSLFTNVDSRSAPASAGLLGALMGTFWMMLIVIVLAVPLGVGSAIYLEEFAPKSRLTDLIEVNINNLAAVPSIVFGLLGAAVFINWFRLPLSAPLAGGLVLTLMTLPTIIIATRAALKGVSPALRQAALGMGASKTQMVFHHVLPVTFPSILTATIIGVAQAMGETAPLLLIGMNAFVAAVPATPIEQATALPVQIYLWQGNENRNFFEPRTSAAIMVLLAFMITLNAIAIFLRSRLEKRA